MAVSFSLLTATQEEIDAAQRLSDIVNSLAISQPFEVLCHSWIAVRLQDGNTDGELYDNRRDAVRHQSDEKLCAYICLREAPGGMDLRAAFAVLQYHRAVYDAGGRLPDPDAYQGGTDVYMPLPREHVADQIRRLNTRASIRDSYRVPNRAQRRHPKG